MLTSQLPLAIQPHAQMTFANYLPGNNLLITQALQNLVAGASEFYIYLWGQAGYGRSHLLQACCQYAPPQNRTAQYLSFAEAADYPPQILEGWENFDVVCLDDIHFIAGHAEWEEAVFHLYNRLLAARHHLVISGNMPPAYLNIQLPDLKSRLSAGLVLQLQDLDDDDKIKVLQLQARQRGLELSDEIGRYLLKRYSRALPALLTILDDLDKASLAAQRRLTIPFVKSVLVL